MLYSYSINSAIVKLTRCLVPNFICGFFEALVLSRFREVFLLQKLVIEYDNTINLMTRLFSWSVKFVWGWCLLYATWLELARLIGRIALAYVANGANGDELRAWYQYNGPLRSMYCTRKGSKWYSRAHHKLAAREYKTTTDDSVASSLSSMTCIWGYNTSLLLFSYICSIVVS